MWSGGDDLNENGERVRLYQPILYGRKPVQEDPTASYIGGDDDNQFPLDGTTATCSSCQNSLQLLAQLYVPQYRTAHGSTPVAKTLQISACRRASCWNQLFTEGKISDGQGVVRCRRLCRDRLDYCREKFQASRQQETTLPSRTDSPSPHTNTIAADDWAVPADVTEDNSLGDLEVQLAALEAAEGSSRKPAKPWKRTRPQQCAFSKFSCFELSHVQEPGAIAPLDDEDDVGLSKTDDNAKIQAMLARYLAEEDDTDIINALRPSMNTGGGSTWTATEPDERLSVEDRALWTFTDRLQRSPRQVLRYALGGVPLWSIPVSVALSSKVLSTPPIPACVCGAPRVYECQLLPSVLAILRVDQPQHESIWGDALDFGNVAVYSCTAACADADEEFVVVQQSVDAWPAEGVDPRRNDDATAAVVIPEDARFSVDDDDDDEQNGG